MLLDYLGHQIGGTSRVFVIGFAGRSFGRKMAGKQKTAVQGRTHRRFIRERSAQGGEMTAQSASFAKISVAVVETQYTNVCDMYHLQFRKTAMQKLHDWQRGRGDLSLYFLLLFSGSTSH